MLKNTLKRFLSGISVEKEYPCVDYQLLKDEVKVILVHDGGKTDVTADHVFLGYKPVIAGVYLPANTATGNVIQLQFIHRFGKVLACLQLRQYSKFPIGESAFVVFTGVHADVHLLPFLRRATNSLLRKLQKKARGNVDMQGNEYHQVQAMYTVPRKISVISLGGDGLYNMFPTDLHGNIGEGFYVDSLRKAGKACSQVLQFRKIVKADVALSFMNEAYAMGKNHMREPAVLSDFPANGYSELLGLPLPAGATAYKELELYDHLEIGIHRVLVFKVLHETVIGKAPILSCVNWHYAQWRLDHGLSFEYV